MSSFSANRFALLSEDGDDAPAPAVKDVPKAVSDSPNKPIPVPTQKPRSGQAGRGRGGDYPSRGGARNVLREDREAQPAAGGADDGREPRGERRGRGGPRGGRGGLGRGRGGRGGAKVDRPDRHSQTGVTDTEKKIASGWGAEEGKSELQAENDGWGDAKADASIPGTPGANGTDAAPGVDGAAPAEEAVAAKPVEEEEVDNTKTLDEFLAERAAATRIGGSLAGRQANEGADESQWKDGVQLLKDDQEDADWFMGKAASKKAATSNAKKTKTFIDVEPMGYRPPRSDRGGRGSDRGDRGGRGGRGRGEGRGGRGRGEGRGAFRGARGGAPSRELNTEDSSAFPSLS